MNKIKSAIMIDAPVERVFAYFSDAKNLPEIWPSMIAGENVVEHNGQRSFDWIYKMAGIRFEGHSDTLEFVPNERVVTRSEKGIPSTFTNSYKSVGDRTEVTIAVEYEIPNRVLSRLAEPIIRRLNEREATILLGNLKDRMEMAQVVGERAATQARQPSTH